MTDSQINKDRLEYLKLLYTPDAECIRSDFACDYRVDDSNECPCQWALGQSDKEIHKHNHHLLCQMKTRIDIATYRGGIGGKIRDDVNKSIEDKVNRSLLYGEENMKKHFTGAVYDLTQENMQNLITQLEEAQSFLKKADEIIEVVVAVHPDNCWHDHHGYCQEHNLEEDCHVKKAKEYIVERGLGG